MAHKIALLLFLCSMSLAARAGDVFKWVDENGKVHYGDTVPEKYRKESKKVDSSGPEATAAQRREAEARIAKEKARLDALEKSRDATADTPQSGPAPAPVAQAKDECEEQMKKYLESMACFDKYRNAPTSTLVGGFRISSGGGVKPEAFQHCKEVPQPRGCFAPAGSVERTYIPPAP